MDLARSGFPSEIAHLKPNEYPFYFATYDPFKVSDEWKKSLNIPRFKETLQQLVKLNLDAITLGYSKKELFEGKRFYGNDICLQACLMSYKEIFEAQREVVDLTGIISTMDLTNFGELFEGYGKKEKRTYHNSMIFMLNWFSQLIEQYRRQGFTMDRFCDFTRLGSGYHHIRREVISLGSILELYMYPAGTLVLDFNKGQTKLQAKDYFMYEFTGKSEYLSEILERENPFGEKQTLNFILPTNYRKQCLPLVNVSEIVLEGRDGKRKFSADRIR